MKKLSYLTIAPALVALCFAATVASAQEGTTSVRGTLELPENAGDGINTEGLSLDDATILMQGPYNYPRKPYPADWKEMNPEQRREWNTEFKESEAFGVYQKKIEEAKANRTTFETTISADGSFVFEEVKPSWYELTVRIMHPNAEERNYEQSRANAMKQFFVRNVDKPHDFGVIELDVKNVLMPGDTAPLWTIRSFEGKEVNLADFRGKYVLFDFWATWCGPCIEEIPNLKKAHAEFGGERLAVVGINTDTEQGTAQDWLDDNPPTFQQLFMGFGENHAAVSTAYGFTSIPSIWLIGPDGKIVARDLHGKALQEAVANAMNATEK